MKELTPRQQEALNLIFCYTAEHGYPPSTRELGKLLGVSSSSTAHALLAALQKRGYIKHGGTSRGLVMGAVVSAKDREIASLKRQLAALQNAA